MPQWAAEEETARGADLETALEETARDATGAAVGTAKDVGETARLPKMRRQDGFQDNMTP